MKLLVAIHDVTPVWDDALRELWAGCLAADATPALFVVPNWHGRSPLQSSPAFVRWLRECEDRGAEIFLHGFRHDEVGSRRSVREQLAAFGRTAGEAEFLSVSRAEGAARMEVGAALLRQVGLTPVGFVPPAWLAKPWVQGVAVAQGLHLSENDVGIRWDETSRTTPVRGGSRTLRAPAVRWSARSGWRARLSESVALARRGMHAASPMVRVALHPRDLTHQSTRRSVDAALRWWTVRREATSYGAAVGRSG
ncbi:MAG: DUF2334 domain-containing protein [Gemmatimonadota bacterium]